MSRMLKPLGFKVATATTTPIEEFEFLPSYSIPSSGDDHKSPPLVGIEPNPGPVPLAGALAASAVKSLLKSAIKKGKSESLKVIRTKAEKKKKTKKSRQKPMSQALTVRAPVAGATISRGPNNLRTHREPFTCVGLKIVTDVLGNPAIVNNVLSPTGVFYPSVDLYCNPNGRLPSSQSFGAFGPVLTALSRIYSRWRLASLQVHLDGIQPTSTAGNLLIAYSPDPYDASSSYMTLAAVEDSISSPAYQAGTAVCLNVNHDLYNDWLYTTPNDDQVPTQRQCCAGSLSVSGVGLPTGRDLFILRLTGVMEFHTIDPTASVGADESTFPYEGDLDQLNLTATAAAPFGPAMPVYPLLPGPPDYTLHQNSDQFVSFGPLSINFNRNDVFRIRITWTDVAGVITGPASVTGTNEAGVISSSFSGAVPYSSEIVVGANNSTPFSSYVTIAGPTGMTAGNAHINILQL